MTTTYVTITQAEIAALVTELSTKLATTWKQANPTQEIYHAWPVTHDSRLATRLEIRYYTSITPTDEVAREAGADAMRVCILKHPRTRDERLMTTLTRVHRVAGWQDRVRERMREAWLLVTHGPLCPACGDRMLPVPVRSSRKDSKDKRTGKSKIVRYFWSCVAYPSCRGTQSIVDETGHSVKKATLADAVAQASRERDKKLAQTPAVATATTLARELDVFFQGAAAFAADWRAKRLSPADVEQGVTGLCKNWLAEKLEGCPCLLLDEIRLRRVITFMRVSQQEQLDELLDVLNEK